MEFDRAKNLTQKLFIGFAVLGLIFNIVFDFIAFSENRTSDVFDQKFHTLMQASLNVERLDKALNTQKASKQQDIQIELNQLRQLHLTIPGAPSLDQLKTTLLQDSDDASEFMLSQLRMSLSKELMKIQKVDTEQSDVVDKKIMGALALDVILIAIMFTLFILNVRTKKRTEEALRRSLLNMRNTLISLEEQTLKRSLSAKTLVHDLKNPIGTIMGFAQLLKEDPGSELSVVEFSDRIKKISEGCLTLVENLLVTPEEKPFEMDKVNFSILTQQICSQFEIQARIKRQQIISQISEIPCIVKGNQNKLEELLSNIISNAIKYSPFDSTITVSLTSIDSYQLELLIEDQGPGFTEVDKRKAFQLGQKLSAQPTNGESSTGFGLYIAKRTVELHKGSIEILKGTNKGTQFRIKLPLYVENRLQPELS